MEGCWASGSRPTCAVIYRLQGGILRCPIDVAPERTTESVPGFVTLNGVAHAQCICRGHAFNRVRYECICPAPLAFVEFRVFGSHPAARWLYRKRLLRVGRCPAGCTCGRARPSKPKLAGIFAACRHFKLVPRAPRLGQARRRTLGRVHRRCWFAVLHVVLALRVLVEIAEAAGSRPADFSKRMRFFAACGRHICCCAVRNSKFQRHMPPTRSRQ